VSDDHRKQIRDQKLVLDQIQEAFTRGRTRSSAALTP
jgi:hypothetical protein